MKKLFSILIVTFIVTTLFGQEKPFVFEGKPVVTVFANYHAGIGKENKKSGFELGRAYLGYQFKVHPQLSGKVIFDIGTTKVQGSDLERVAFVKNALLSWTPGNLTLDFGLIKLEQFSIQESFWGYRYVMKSFNDEYKFGNSADMGIIGKYRFTPQISADITISNGEGYKKLNKDNKYRYGAGVTVNPIKEITIRGYYDIHNGPDHDQSALAIFAGYKHTCFSVGAEYNKMFNTKFVKDLDREGFSVYGKMNVYKKWNVFGRYDYLKTVHDNTAADNGQCIIAGAEYRPLKSLKLSPNFRTWNPKNGNSGSYLYLNLEFKI